MSQEPYRPPAFDEPPPREPLPAAISIALYLVLTLVTCGVWNLYWNYVQMRECNLLLGRQEFSWLPWLLLTIITCGIYHLYYQYKMGAAINEIQLENDLLVMEGLPVLSVVTAILGVGVIADCIHQNELNKIVEALG